MRWRQTRDVVFAFLEQKTGHQILEQAIWLYSYIYIHTV